MAEKSVQSLVKNMNATNAYTNSKSAKKEVAAVGTDPAGIAQEEFGNDPLTITAEAEEIGAKAGVEMAVVVDSRSKNKGASSVSAS